ncbi:MAG: putative peptidoglycan lipid flippase [Clostridiales bacterium]|nr:putative peptidoglycan lipid flippase [Clostridiales bacterium]
MMKNKSRVVSSVMIITLVSKGMGFVRDMVLAFYFGATGITDAYFVSQTIPEFLFSLVVQAISVGFIPIYSEIVHTEGREKGDSFVDKLLTFCIILTCVLTIFVGLFGTQFVMIFASGFSDEITAVAVHFVRITVFAMFFRIATSIWSSYLQANNRFIFPAMVGIPLNVIVLVSIVAAAYTFTDMLAYGLVLASAGSMLLLLPSVIKSKGGYRFYKDFYSDKHIKRVLQLFIPISIGVGANQINVLVDRTVASSFSGGISALNYANKVDNVLENVIVLSLATVLFTTFADCVSKKDIQGFKRNVNKAIDIILITMIPISVYAIVFSTQIIQLLFGHGQFDKVANTQTAIAMAYYSLGLVALSVHAILTRAFYALNDVKTVTKNSCIAIVINVGLNFLLPRIIGIGGIALATSISNIYTAISLLYLLQKKVGSMGYKKLTVDFLKLCVAAICLGLSAYFSFSFFLLYLNYWIAFIFAIICGGMIFVLICLFLKPNSVVLALALLKKKQNEA